MLINKLFIFLIIYFFNLFLHFIKFRPYFCMPFSFTLVHQLLKRFSFQFIHKSQFLWILVKKFLLLTVRVRHDVREQFTFSWIRSIVPPAIGNRSLRKFGISNFFFYSSSFLPLSKWFKSFFYVSRIDDSPSELSSDPLFLSFCLIWMSTLIMCLDASFWAPFPFFRLLLYDFLWIDFSYEENTFYV